MSRHALAIVFVFVLGWASAASAQLDPLLFLKRTAPNVLVAIDTGSRMQRDAPTDPTNPLATSSFYDPYIYSTASTPAAVRDTLRLSSDDVSYRRRYAGLTPKPSSAGSALGTAWISAVTSRNLIANPNPTSSTLDARSDYSSFEAPTRLSIARAALFVAVQENQRVARFGLYKMRQSGLAAATRANAGPVTAESSLQDQSGSTDAPDGAWHVSMALVDASNGSNVTAASGGSIQLGLRPDDEDANKNILTLLARDARASGALLAAGQDDSQSTDEPLQYMVDDVKSEAMRIGLADAARNMCRNTVVVLITGGGEGTTATGHDPVGSAATLLTAVPGHRVPIIVIALAPPSADVDQLRSIASASGGQYFEITRSDIDAAFAMSAFVSPVPGTVLVPEVLRAINVAIQTAFQEYRDLNTAQFWGGSWAGWSGYGGSVKIPSTEFQVTKPIVGTVNLEGATDARGTALPATVIDDRQHRKIQQRSNVMVTSGFVLPGFDGMLRAFRVYKPQADASRVSGYKFVADGSPLWIASTPSDPAQRNLYTARADGTVIAFTAANAAALASLMNVSVADARVVIEAVRRQPLGAIVDSTPAVMDPPSLEPAPDADYPAFVDRNKDRRSIVWVGTNRGILEAIDARSGIEVWGFIPLNILPKLKTVLEGESVGNFEFLLDGSPKVADLKVDGVWRTYLITGEGAGGTFYQAFDVTLTGMADTISPSNGMISDLLRYFADSSKIGLRWAFPRYSVFDPMIGPRGDISPDATPVEKTVGQAWSEPAVGQVADPASPYVIVVGSGLLSPTIQSAPNRSGVVAGTTLYLLDAATGAVFDARNVGSDGVNESVDDCATTAEGCRRLKNALQGAPVVAGRSGSLLIDRAYAGDLDGTLWRFDLELDGAGKPTINAATKLYTTGSDQPIFGSPATVTVNRTARYVFYGTGSDLLPSTAGPPTSHLIGIRDNGSAGVKTMEWALAKISDGGSLSADEKLAASPIIAGDIVFFTTTTFRPSTPCVASDANLYAFTFVGGPAYDNTSDAVVTKADTPLVRTTSGGRATAPFAIDRHLVFGTSDGRVEMFGDPDDFNTGFGQARVRIISWREVG